MPCAARRPSLVRMSCLNVPYEHGVGGFLRTRHSKIRVGAAAGRPEVFTCTILLHLVTVTWRLHNDLSCIPVCESEFLTQECSPKSLTLNVKTSGGAMIFSVCATCRCNHSGLCVTRACTGPRYLAPGASHKLPPGPIPIYMM